ncbi:MAG: OadG family protein [Lachnospiraceae bacterium]
MKKFIAMLCILTCVLGFTGCGEEKNYTELEKTKGETAVLYSEMILMPYMMQYFDEAEVVKVQENCNVHEIKYIAEKTINQAFGVDMNIEGNAILTGMVSFNNTYESLGDIDLTQGFDGTYEITGDEIIVTVPVTGSKTDANGNLRTAKAEFIFSNDIFYTVKSCALNLDQSMGELMGKAGMDTLMGMAVVFTILIMISILIWIMGGIPGLIDALSGKGKKEKKQDIKEEAVNNTIAQIIEKEESADDTELVAVIAAAIAAYEGSQSTDGFVVRSIRKRR